VFYVFQTGVHFNLLLFWENVSFFVLHGNFIVYDNLVTELSIFFQPIVGAGLDPARAALRRRNGQDRSLQSVGANCVRPLNALTIAVIAGLTRNLT